MWLALTPPNCCNDCNWNITATNWNAVLIERAGLTSVCLVLKPFFNKSSNGIVKQLCSPTA